MVHRRAGSTVGRLTSLAVRTGSTGKAASDERSSPPRRRRARRRGCGRLRLEVRAENSRAQTLYEAAGYRRFAIARTTTRTVSRPCDTRKLFCMAVHSRDQLERIDSRRSATKALRRGRAAASPFSAVAPAASPIAPAGIEILAHPAEADRLRRPQVPEAPFHLHRRAGRKSPPRPSSRSGRKASISEVSASPAMDAVARFHAQKRPRRIAEPVPGRVHREHAVADAEFARDDVDDRRHCRHGS